MTAKALMNTKSNAVRVGLLIVLQSLIPLCRRGAGSGAADRRRTGKTHSSGSSDRRRNP